jgi:ribosomal protein L11 methyltransferase
VIPCGLFFKEYMKRISKLHEVLLTGGVQCVAPDLVRLSLVGAGVLLSDIVEEENRAGYKMSVFFEKAPDAQRLRLRLRSLKLKGVRLSARIHHRTDWESRWKESWRPFSLTGKIALIPLFLTGAKCPKGKMPLYLDTTAAFGTGLHETTRFSSRLIEGLSGKFKTFLDIGTGTGILAIVALLSGAGRVEAFDIDKEAVKVARDNFKANGLKCHALKACDVKGYNAKKAFDLVAANLITHDLVSFKDKIIASVRIDGYLIISGIYRWSCAPMMLVLD